MRPSRNLACGFNDEPARSAACPKFAKGMQEGITAGSKRDMGKLFKAAAGFAIALTLLYGQGYWAGWPVLAGVKSDIAAAAPLPRLQAQFDTGLRAYGLHRDAWKPGGSGR